MRRENGISQSPRGAQRPLQVCSIAALVATLLWMVWIFVPVFSGGGSLDVATISRRVLIPIAFIILNATAVMLVASVVGAMFAAAKWRSGQMAARALLTGVFLFAAEAMLMWRLSLALGSSHRADPVSSIVAGIAVSFLSTWVLLEPLLRLPRDASDAANLDGLGFAGLYWHVLLPRMTPRIHVASLPPFVAALAYVLPGLVAGS